MKTSAILSAVGAAAVASAHGVVSSLTIDGQSYTAYNPYGDPYMNPAPERITWTVPSNSPVEDVTTSAIACNVDSKAGAISATATAGSKITFFWTVWPDSHKGPVMTYLAACPGSSCTTVTDPTTLEFFKIDADGLNADGTWASDELIANNNTWTVTIPETLKAGAYLVRHEILALHSAGTLNGAQFYPMCANLEVTGSGTATPPSTDLVKFPGAYTATDPGIEINIYYPVPTSYTIPGPAVWPASGSGSASSASSVAASSTVAVVPSSTAAVSSAPASSTTSVAAISSSTTLAAVSSVPVVGTGFIGTGTASAGFSQSTIAIDPVSVAPTATTGTDGVMTSTLNVVVTATSVQTVVMTLTRSHVETKTVTVTPSSAAAKTVTVTVTSAGAAVPACTPAGRFRRDLW